MLDHFLKTSFLFLIFPWSRAIVAAISSQIEFLSSKDSVQLNASKSFDLVSQTKSTEVLIS